MQETLRDFVEEWLPAARLSLRPSTFESYKANLVHHVLPRFGDVALADLAPLDLNRHYADLLAWGRVDGGGGLSNKTVHYVHTIVHRVLRDACKWGKLDRNVAELTEPPRQVRPEVNAWGEREARLFLDAVRGDHLYPLYLLAITTGLRRGELLGLTWKSLDFSSTRLFVSQALVVVNYELVMSSPKTRRSRRSVALDDASIAALRVHHDNQRTERDGDKTTTPDGLVFTRPDGSPLHPHSVSQGFDRRLRKLDLPRIRFHDLRHTSASLALAAGVHPKVVSERLGHASVMITLDTYSHVVPSLQQDAAERIADLLV